MNRTEIDSVFRSQFAESWFGDKPILELDVSRLSHKEWEVIRNSLIAVGGSDIATVMGFNGYKIARRLWYEKLGLLDNSFKAEGNKYIFMGHYFEDAIAELWTYWDEGWIKTMQNYNEGIQTRAYESRGMLIDPERPYIVANIDGMITVHPKYESEGILEIKKMTSRSRDAYESRINPGHIFQVQGYMMVTGAEYGELVIMEEALDLDVYLVTPNKTIQDMVDEECFKFVDTLHRGFEIIRNENNKLKREQYLSEIEPDEQDSKLLSEFYTAKRKAIEVDKKTIPASPEFLELVLKREMLDMQIKELLDDKDIYDSKIKGVFTKEQVTEIILTEYNGKDIPVRFDNRLYIHPFVKSKLLQNTTT